MSEMAIGMVGLGVMGRNLALNIEEKGFSVAAWDAWPRAGRPLRRGVEGQADPRLPRARGLREGAAPAAADHHAREGGRGRRQDDRRAPARCSSRATCSSTAATSTTRTPSAARRELARRKIRYFGMGVSGGELGARHGPSMMPGGDREGYDELAPILTKIAAQHPDGPCVTYIGPGGSGHYVKMVHNGIEYGDMQLIAEAYDALKTLGGLSNAELADVFDAWNQAELESYLIEITAQDLPREGSRGEGRARRPHPRRDRAEGHRQVDGAGGRRDRRRRCRPSATLGRRARHLVREGRTACTPSALLAGAHARRRAPASTRSSSSPTCAPRSTPPRRAATRRA